MNSIEAFQVGWQEYHGLTAAYSRRQRSELRALANGGDPLEVTGVELRAWLERHIAAGLQASAVGQKLIEVRPFFTWAYENGLIDAERLMQIRSVRAPRNGNRANPRPYSAKDRARFWRDFDRDYPWVRDVYGTRPEHRGENTEERGAMFLERWCEGRSPWARARPYCKRLQTEAIIQLAMIGGLRRIEVFTLELDDLDADNEYVIVQGARKGNGRAKERAVPWLTEGLRDAVAKWLAVRAQILAAQAPMQPHERPWLYLVANGHGFPGDRMRFKPFERQIRLIGPKGAGWQWHRMRHTAITEMLRAGYPIQTVSEIAGHANIAMTMRYAKLLREDVVHQARINQARYERQMGRVA